MLARNNPVTDALDRHVIVDWKTPGREFLDLFADVYPELTFLESTAFDALVDELSNECPDACFDDLAAFAGEHGHSLWELDPGSDTHLLALVPVLREREFIAHWTHSAGRSQYASPPVRLGCGAAGASTPVRVRTLERKPRPALVDDRWDFDGQAPMPQDGDDEQLVHPWHDEDQQEQQRPTLWDVTRWPPRQIVSREVLEQIDRCAHFHPLYASGAERWWDREVRLGKKTAPRRELVRIRSLEPYADEVVADLSHYPRCEWPKVTGCGASVFVAALEPGGGPGRRYRLQRQVGALVETWFESITPVVCLPLGPDDVLVHGGHVHPTWISHGAAVEVSALPRDLSEASAPFALSAHELVYFTAVRRSHPEVANVDERRLRMHRFDLRTGRHRSAVLEDLFANQRLDLVKRSVRYQHCGGDIQAQRGHGTWWILNYSSQEFGKKDLAWMWNCHSDDVLRIGPELFPRLEPEFGYLPSIDRYVARADSALLLLREFAALRPHLRPVELRWTDA